MPSAKKPKMKKKSIDEVPSFPKHSLAKLERALSDLGEDWMWQREFIEYYSLTAYCISRHGCKFEDYRVRFGQRYVWTGSRTTAKKLRGMC